MTVAKTSRPRTGWRRKRSIAFVAASGSLSGFVRVTTWSWTCSAHAASACSSAVGCGSWRCCGVVWLRVWLRVCVRLSSPCPDLALIGTIGVWSRFSSFARSSWRPRFCVTSVMLTAMTVGSCFSSICATSTRFLARFDASTTMQTASGCAGLSPVVAALPWRTSLAIFASSWSRLSA